MAQTPLFTLLLLLLFAPLSYAASPTSRPTSKPLSTPQNPPTTAPSNQPPGRTTAPTTTSPTPHQAAPTTRPVRALPPQTTTTPHVAPRRIAPPTPSIQTPPSTPSHRIVPPTRPRLSPPMPLSRRTLPPSKTPMKPSWFRLSYLIDWGVSVAFAGAAMGIYFIEPPQRTFRRDDPTIGLTYKPDTISEEALAGLALGIPLATFALAQIGLRSGHDFHHAALGLAEAFSMTLFFTTLLKVTVGRLRPDFVDRCQPDANLNCQGDPATVTKGRKSFPSGHSSFAFAGGVYMALYLWGKLRPFHEPGAFWKVPVILLPVTAAALVGVSRITDNRHHWEDVLVGALLGTGFAFLAYHLNFPAPWSKDSATPRTRGRISVAPILSTERVGLAIQGSW